LSDHIVPNSPMVCLHGSEEQTTPAQPRLLDLFCGEGGAGAGYLAAGFNVTGVDHEKARGRHYPGEFIHADALAYVEEHGHEYDAIHASPPCQAYSITRHSHKVEHPALLDPTREALTTLGIPYVIENVPGAPLDHPITLCGAYFDRTALDHDGTRLVLRRHRLFESNVWIWPTPCYCIAYRIRGFKVAGSYGGGSQTRAKAKVRRGGYTPGKDTRADLLGVEFPMTWQGLADAIPPSYTKHIGADLLAALGQDPTTSAQPPKVWPPPFQVDTSDDGQLPLFHHP
jgi:DNA (cytosine-5)-methyltransferase 1